MTTATRRRSSLGFPKKSTKIPNEADKVLAATAGADNWKTWAGRNHGTDEFEVLDSFRGLRRSIHHRFLAAPPPPGTTCPVCFCEPEQNEWHVTSSCSHAVCLDCLKAYAASQVHDREQNGPLRCPVCPQALRRSDAIIALGNNKELIKNWDEKIRNQVLRALPSYRSCPKCNNHNTNTKNDSASKRRQSNDPNVDETPNESESSQNFGGGGFVTPECLSPQYQERRSEATKLLYGLDGVILAAVALYILLVVIISNRPSPAAGVDLFFILVLIPTLIRVARVGQKRVAEAARKAFFKPITVECPCCDEKFILPPEMEARNMENAETSRWLTANTRPCPSCSVPINKSGGCNHMRCAHCNASFCWACMKLRTNCAAYNCTNGAPFRNAVPSIGTPLPASNNAENVLTAIDSILSRRRATLSKIDGLVFFFALFGRHFEVVQTIVNYVMMPILSLIAAAFTSGFATTAVVGYTVYLTYRINRDNNRARTMQGQQQQQQQLHRHVPLTFDEEPPFRGGHAPRRESLTASEFLLGADERNQRQRQSNVILMTEQEMIAEAIRRSVQEQ